MYLGCYLLSVSLLPIPSALIASLLNDALVFILIEDEMRYGEGGVFTQLRCNCSPLESLGPSRTTVYTHTPLQHPETDVSSAQRQFVSAVCSVLITVDLLCSLHGGTSA